MPLLWESFYLDFFSKRYLRLLQTREPPLLLLEKPLFFHGTLPAPSFLLPMLFHPLSSMLFLCRYQDCAYTHSLILFSKCNAWQLLFIYCVSAHIPVGSLIPPPLLSAFLPAKPYIFPSALLCHILIVDRRSCCAFS